MITKLIKKFNTKANETERFDFKEKYEGIAGTCPDCGSIVTYDILFHKYICINQDCGFEANINRERIMKRISKQSEQTSEQTI